MLEGKRGNIMNTKHLILCTTLTLAITSCSSIDEEISERSDIPLWVLSPHVDGGLAATDCVVFSGNLSVDRKMATANSRIILAQQISLNIDNLDKTYQNRIDASKDFTVGGTFSSVSKQLTRLTLNGSLVSKADMVEIKDVEHFCVQTSVTPEKTDELIDNLLKQTSRPLSGEEDKFLRQEFKAFKANEQLERELTM